MKTLASFWLAYWRVDALQYLNRQIRELELQHVDALTIKARADAHLACIRTQLHELMNERVNLEKK